MIKIIKTLLVDLKETLIENIPMRLFLGVNFMTLTVGVYILTLLKMIPPEIGRPITAFGILGIAIFMLCTYLWGKRHPNIEPKQKIDKDELIAFFCGILGGLFFTLGILVSVK